LSQIKFNLTGEVSQMSQKDIEPLREICYCLGISSLITRLDDVKLTISFQVGLTFYRTLSPS
jgi:hypothetical protein